METTFKYNLLFDFYGPLLTQRQRDIYQMYYWEDLSLGEIAEQLDISRQAVHDNIKRSSKILADFESKLGLTNKYFAQQNILEQIELEAENLLKLFDDNNKDHDQVGMVKNILNLITKIRTDS